MMQCKGIILVGGFGIWLYLIIKGVSKQLLLVYDKLMIYYLFSVLMLVGICEVLIINILYEQMFFQQLLGDGLQWGMDIQYVVQLSLDGLVQVYLIGCDFVVGKLSCFVLGDNIFYGYGLCDVFNCVDECVEGFMVFGYWVNDLECYGVVEFDKSGKVIDLVEKLEKLCLNYVVIGLYFYDGNVSVYVVEFKLLLCGELEIIDFNKCYLVEGNLYLEVLGCGYVWFDIGIYQLLLEVFNFIEIIQICQGLQVCCLEEIVFGKGWISVEQLEVLVVLLIKNVYG